MGGIDWQGVVRSHRDFVTAGPDPELSQGVCLRDGCGSACFYGLDAWRQAAHHLGFDRATVDLTDIARIDLVEAEKLRRRVFA